MNKFKWDHITWHSFVVNYSKMPVSDLKEKFNLSDIEIGKKIKRVNEIKNNLTKEFGSNQITISNIIKECMRSEKSVNNQKDLEGVFSHIENKAKCL